MVDVVAVDAKKRPSNDDELKLYDDILANQPRTNFVAPSDLPYGIPDDYTGKKVALIVASLQWWTSDRDLAEAVKGLGVYDLMEIKFFENKSNGQSKGMAVLTLQKDESVNILIEELPKIAFNGKYPITARCTRNNLEHYKALCGGDGDSRKKEVPKTEAPPLSRVAYGQTDRLPNPLYNNYNSYWMDQLMLPNPHVGYDGSQKAVSSVGKSAMGNGGNSPANITRRHMNKEDLESMVRKNWEVTNKAIKSSKESASDGADKVGIKILHTAASMIRQSLVVDDPRCQKMIGKLEDVYDDLNRRLRGKRKRRRSRSRSRRRRSSRRGYSNRDRSSSRRS